MVRVVSRSMSMLLAAVLLAGAAGAAPGAAGEMQAVIAAYLDMQQQLAADKTDGVKARAQAIREAALKMGEPGATLAKSAAAIEQAPDLNAVREAFGPLSEAVIAAAKADGTTDLSGLKLAYCPMVKESWLQKGDKIQNPYYGQSMLTCGEFRKIQ